MQKICVCCNSLTPPLPSVRQHPLHPIIHATGTTFAPKSRAFSLNSILKSCQTCGGKGAIECPGSAPRVVLYNLVLGNHSHSAAAKFLFLRAGTTNTRLQVHSSRKPQRAPPGVDTRIHWENEDEGWIGGQQTSAKEKPSDLLGEKYADLLTTSSGSHYEFLGLSPDADLEEIKVAYRRLTKEYHPDTTSLPLKIASEKFMKLREVYDVLSNEESRRFYDWTLAQEAASRQAEKMKMKLEDPREQEVKTWESVPDMVDRLGGRNLKLGDQAVSALTIDVFIIIFAICCIIYVIFFKEPSYY